MKLSLQDCIDKIKKEYPQSYPYTFIECEGKYVFNLVAKGEDPNSAINDMHVVDPESGSITGGISIMEFLKNKGFREAWKHANLVANNDKSLEHSSCYSEESKRRWRVRKNSKNSESFFFMRKE